MDHMDCAPAQVLELASLVAQEDHDDGKWLETKRSWHSTRQSLNWQCGSQPWTAQWTLDPQIEPGECMSSYWSDLQRARACWDPQLAELSWQWLQQQQHHHQQRQQLQRRHPPRHQQCSHSRQPRHRQHRMQRESSQTCGGPAACGKVGSETLQQESLGGDSHRGENLVLVEDSTEAASTGSSAPTLNTTDLVSSSEATLSEEMDDVDLSFLIRMEGASNSAEVLQIGSDAVARLTPETTISVLHLAARHLPAHGSELRETRSSVELATVLGHLRQLLPRVRQPRLLSRLAWTLGKLEVHNADVDATVSHLCNVAPTVLQKFTPQDLTNTLWGLARLYPGGRGCKRSGGVAAVLRLAHAIVGACSRRVEALTAQCVSNSLWAIARLRLNGQEVEIFLALCLRELLGRRGRHLSVFTSQGLANTLWALAELHTCGVHPSSSSALGDIPTSSLSLDIATFSLPDRGGARCGGVHYTVQQACAVVAADAGDRLHEFMAQELSMLAWACAKVFGRSPASFQVIGSKSQRRGGAGAAANHRGGNARPEKVDSLLFGLAAEATQRLPEFSPQGISNIAWALATLDLLGPQHVCAPAREFLTEAMAAATPCLAMYAPQAVANLLWAAVRLDPPDDASTSPFATLQYFAAAAAKDATLRMLEFTWRDLAGVSVALAHRSLQVPEALTFATLLVGHAASRCAELTPQMMLNIAQSATRLGVPVAAMQAMVDGIAACIAARQLQFNEVDQRQWREVQSWCAPRVADSVFAPAWL